MRSLLISVAVAWAVACGDDGGPVSDAGLDAMAAPDAGPGPDAGADAGPSSTPGITDDDPAAWLSYGNGPHNTFYNAHETRLGVDNAAELRVLWRFEGHGSVTAPPAVANGRVYVTTNEATFALDAATGEQLWEASFGTTSSPALDLASGTLYLNAGGVMHALAMEDGRQKWSTPTTMQQGRNGFSSPVVVGRQVVVGISSQDFGNTFRGGLVAMDKDTGEIDWSYLHSIPPAAGISVWAGPGIDAELGMAYGPGGNNYGEMKDEHSDSIFAVDLQNGELMWNHQGTPDDGWTFQCNSCGPDEDFGTNPIVLEWEGRNLVGAGQKSGTFWMLDAETGQVRWEREVSTMSSSLIGGVLNNGAFDGEHIIVAGNEALSGATLYALDPADGTVAWQQPLDGPVWAPITVANGVCFVPVSETLQVRDCSDGTLLNEFTEGGTVGGAAAISDGRVFYGSGFGYFPPVQDGQNFIALGLP